MTAYIYNCKACKRGRRVEYPEKLPSGLYCRRDDDGKAVSGGIWVNARTWARPKNPHGLVVERATSQGTQYTEYGGDPLGLCDGCRRPMTSGRLTAVYSASVACDPRCTDARGHNCTCNCGGKNHGAAHLFTGLLAGAAA
jgi:hypothetical protein